MRHFLHGPALPHAPTLLRATALLLALTLLAPGCGARSAETRDPNAIVCAWIGGADGFNPLVATSSASQMVYHLIYSALVDMDSRSDMRPNWPTSLISHVDIQDGGKRYVLHLRRGVRWSDGTPLLADDVVFSVRLIANPGLPESNPGDFSLMRSVRALDDHTIELRLASPSPPFLENALGETFVLPKRILRRYPADSKAEAKFVIGDAAFSQHPVISGPWRIERSVRDSYLILTPNPRYWGRRPLLDEIAFRVYPEQDSLYAAVAAGEVDVTDIPPQLWRVRRRLRGNYTFVDWPWNVAFTLVPNYHDPAIPWMSDPLVKRAMMYALDRQFMIDGILSGQGDVLNGPLPTFSPYYDRSVATYRYDPAQARRLLEADGWKLRGNVRMKAGKALRITLKTEGATDAVGSAIAELIQANFRAVGIDCSLDNEELQTFFNDELSSNFQLALTGVILLPYPDGYKRDYSTQTRANGGYNEGFYSNPHIDRAIETARTAPSPRIARAALDRYQELASHDLPRLYLYSNRLGAVVPRNLSGYVLTPLSPAALPMGLEFWHISPRKSAARSSP
ncbi:MAG: peptide ABC transporter substrate-binding protein [Candidatus Eremiobacteraeota bacterium]|nr:peptide ABC transporter substrate-binding protein [Candidatus Eremiobacteraeota bacterium]